MEENLVLRALLWWKKCLMSIGNTILPLKCSFGIGPGYFDSWVKLSRLDWSKSGCNCVRLTFRWIKIGVQPKFLPAWYTWMNPFYESVGFNLAYINPRTFPDTFTNIWLKKVNSTEVPGIRISLNVSTTFCQLKMNR